MKETNTKTQTKTESTEENTEQNQSKGSGVFMKIVNVVINIMIVMVLIISLLVAVMALTSKSDGVSTIFGFTIQSVQSPSMKGGSDEYPGGDFDEGDLIIGKVADPERKDPYEIGDIVTYTGILSGTDQEGLICHRIIQYEDGGGVVGYITKGDNNPDPDSSVHYNDQIKSVFYSKDYKGITLKGFGKVLDYLQSQQGFFLVILLPMIIFFLYELVRVILAFTKYKNAKSDEEKEKSIQDAVAAALAEKEEKSGESIKPEEMTPEQMEQFKQFLAAQKEQQEDNASTEAPAEESTDSPEATEPTEE